MRFVPLLRSQVVLAAGDTEHDLWREIKASIGAFLVIDGMHDQTHEPGRERIDDGLRERVRGWHALTTLQNPLLCRAHFGGPIQTLV